MTKFIKIRVLAALCLGAISVPAFADAGDYPNDFAMAGDLLVARPFGLVWTVAGSAIFVVSLPFTALAGNVKEAADTLVVGPAKETFVRCLGCVNTGRVSGPNEGSN
jgi:hypothetical protein